MVGAAAGDEAAHAALNTRLHTRNTLRMQRYPHRIVLELADVEPSPARGNISITLVTPLSEEPVNRKLCALDFRRVCPDQILCKIAYCEPQCQRADLAFVRTEYDLAHIHEY